MLGVNANVIFDQSVGGRVLTKLEAIIDPTYSANYPLACSSLLILYSKQ